MYLYRNSLISSLALQQFFVDLCTWGITDRGKSIPGSVLPQCNLPIAGVESASEETFLPLHTTLILTGDRGGLVARSRLRERKTSEEITLSGVYCIPFCPEFPHLLCRIYGLTGKNRVIDIGTGWVFSLPLHTILIVTGDRGGLVGRSRLQERKRSEEITLSGVYCIPFCPGFPHLLCRIYGLTSKNRVIDIVAGWVFSLPLHTILILTGDRGGLMARSRFRKRRVPGSKPEFH
ncbi:hypothetical protein AVEN_19202-1 [Araneus ventricosus]|uniref:Uncharacterized protein n=1 Tax=Araneus ventricosus TaxID=182803 RepID=A0A4Y2FT07_ARAVE|nr:hypothetical protein AVEN_19202-1 [Araneus ventricosus]